MLPAGNETNLCVKHLNNDTNGVNESCSSSMSHKDGADGGNRSNGILGKEITAVNSIDFSTELNGRETVRKREAVSSAVSEETATSKRSKLIEDEKQQDSTIDSGYLNNSRVLTDTNINEDPGVSGVDTSANANGHANIYNTNNGVEAEESKVEVKVKHEPVGDADDEVDINNVQPSSSGNCISVGINPAIKIEKADASSTSRESCKFGIRCYRRNPMHRMEEAHPGDHDYKRPSYPPPPKGTPDCPYGDRCYRRNPMHFAQWNHPPETDFEQNYKNYRMRLRQRRSQQSGDDDNNFEFDDDYDLDDPFINDEEFDSDYVPSDNGEEDYEDDYDACDRVEE